MEITVGLSSLNNCTDYSTAMILSSFLIGWGGLSVHMQSLSCISETDLKTGSYILFKFIHGIIAGILTYALLPFFNNF